MRYMCKKSIKNYSLCQIIRSFDFSRYVYTQIYTMFRYIVKVMYLEKTKWRILQNGGSTYSLQNLINLKDIKNTFQKRVEDHTNSNMEPHLLGLRNQLMLELLEWMAAEHKCETMVHVENIKQRPFQTSLISTDPTSLRSLT